MADARILIVEDEAIVALDIQSRLIQRGYSILGRVSNGQDAVRMAIEKRPDLILMDVHLRGELDGIEAADQIRRQYEIPVIYLTAYTTEEIIERAKATQPYGYLI
ncbi:MAG: response regulator, partial [Candidatus Methanoperedens sp.]|nr:response regulator [Candidatus Methanoperedens sp.]